MSARAERADVYERVTASIVATLEAGARPWSPSWDAGPGLGVMPLRANGERYRGVNVLLLWGAAQERGFTQPRWMTFKQAQEQGARVRKGETGTGVVYAGAIVREGEASEAGDEGTVKIPFLKGYTVFNVDQIDGLGAEWFSQPLPARPEPERNAAAETFFEAVGARVDHGGGRACFIPSQDRIQLPERAAFTDAGAYYAVRAHETAHWTGHKDRLARTFGKRFGDNAYAAEELVAEIAAAFLCADLGVSLEPRDDHAAYLAEWLRLMKSDKRAIFTAASAAQAACDYLHGLAAAPAALAA